VAGLDPATHEKPDAALGVLLSSTTRFQRNARECPVLSHFSAG
jgi:hypothetical protein